MNCPSCNSKDYFFGMMGHNCPNPNCSIKGDKKPIVVEVADMYIDWPPELLNQYGEKIREQWIIDPSWKGSFSQYDFHLVNREKPHIIAFQHSSDCWYITPAKRTSKGKQKTGGADVCWTERISLFDALDAFKKEFPKEWEG